MLVEVIGQDLGVIVQAVENTTEAMDIAVTGVLSGG